jgi:hypothetical protein
VAGDHGAHGAFDDHATDVSPQAWAAMHRRVTVGMLMAAAAAIAVGALSRRQDEEEQRREPHHAGPGPRERGRLRRLMQQSV